ncbi:MAG: hypothetical protein ACJ8FY_16800 [Gemmataceae bacterium]
MTELLPMTLIRTSFRHKLPRGLSYAIGAEAISEALWACPRYEELWIAFGPRALPVHPAAEEYAMFGLAFSVMCTNHPCGWYLRVPAVPSDQRAFVRRLMISAGLPNVRKWLCGAHPETWYEGWREFQIGYSVEPPRICFLESHNQRNISSSVAQP